MSAAELREAARLMRERHAAIGGSGARWQVTQCVGHNRDARRTLGEYSLIHDDIAEVALVRGFSSEREVVADYIASWHPAVALAVADWLDAEVADLGPDEDSPEQWISCEKAALAVARAYLAPSRPAAAETAERAGRGTT